MSTVKNLSLSWFAVLAALMSISLASLTLAQESKGDVQAATAEGFDPLRTRDGVAEMFHPANVRLGHFAVDLGLPSDGPDVQIHHAMASLFGVLVADQLERISHGDCNLDLTASLYPFLGGFMFRSDDAEPSEKTGPFCFGLLKQLISKGQFSDGLIKRWTAELRWWFGHNPPDDAPIHNALLAIYDERSTVYRLLSDHSTIFESITVGAFRDWMEHVRASGRIRLLTEDDALQRSLGIPAQDRAAMLPAITMTKTSADVIDVKECRAGIRAAVMIAIEEPADPVVTNDPAVNEAIAKYCPRKQSDLDDRWVPCVFRGGYGHETWIIISFRTVDGMDDKLRTSISDIMADPAIIALAARKREGSRPGKPFIVWFGRH
jgi:hypothetical protein